jgi:hypothetical protein
MASYRINLNIDEKFAKILAELKILYPLLSDPDILKLAVGDFYIKQQNQNTKHNLDSLPVLKLTPKQTAILEKNIEESIASGLNKRKYSDGKSLVSALLDDVN